MQFAKGIKVPLHADNVLSPQVRYHVVAADEPGMTSVVFNLEDGLASLGRVTFEGLDCIRCCRGEHLPYESDSLGPDFPWVFEVRNSTWLQERHAYESRHYKTSLLEEYIHFLFQFHDEFVESIAKGICFEKMNPDEINSPPGRDHPLTDLSVNSPAEEFLATGIACSVRKNTLMQAELIERSKLCSQTLYQYFITLDGVTKPTYKVMLRTLNGSSKTRLGGGFWGKQLLSMDGVGQESEFRESFKGWVSEVAVRRRRMGKLD